MRGGEKKGKKNNFICRRKEGTMGGDSLHTQEGGEGGVCAFLRPAKN